jgi:dTDP-glucose 4,6-dehydratase
MIVYVTGARGFVGHTVVKHILENTDWLVYCPAKGRRLDELGNLERFVETYENIDIIIHAAGNPSALSCIKEPIQAINDNIILTSQMLEIARKNKVQHFIYVSSVEVYGGNQETSYEDSHCVAKNPYAATKLAGEHLCTAYHYSYNIPCSIVRLNNTFGPRCQPERFPVLAIKKLLNDESFVIHCDENGQVGKRRWASIDDVADMILFIIKNSQPGKTYNLTGDLISNLEFLESIAKNMNKTFKYSLKQENIDGRILFQNAPPREIYSIGWRPTKTFEERLSEFVQWTCSHPEWMLQTS